MSCRSTSYLEKSFPNETFKFALRNKIPRTLELQIPHRLYGVTSWPLELLLGEHY